METTGSHKSMISDDRLATISIVNSVARARRASPPKQSLESQLPWRADPPAVNNCEPSGAADAPVTLRIPVDTLSRPSSRRWIDHRCGLYARRRRRSEVASSWVTPDFTTSIRAHRKIGSAGSAVGRIPRSDHRHLVRRRQSDNDRHGAAV